MKKTQLKDAIRNISRRRIAYLSILLTITIGVTGLLCIFFLGSAIEKKASDNYKNSNFRDAEIYSSLGITQEEITELRGSECIEDAEGLFSTPAMMSSTDKVSSITVWSITERINVPALRSGTMPVNADECAVDIPLANKLGISIGDKVHIYAGGTPEGFLRGSEFTVTALMIYPQSISGSTASNVVVPQEAFDPGKTEDGFTCAAITFVMPEDIGIFSEEYLSTADKYISETEPLLADIAKRRTEEIRTKYSDKYNDAKKEADEKLADAEKKLDDAEAEMNEKFAKAGQELAENEKKLKENEEAFETQIKDQKAIIDSAAAMGADVSDKAAMLDAFEKENRETLEEARKKYDTAKQEFEDKKAKAEKELAEKRSEFNEKKKETETTLSDAKQKLDDIKDCSVVIQDRRMNESYEELRNTIRSIYTMAAFFSPVFAVVASVVFFSTIAIIIEDQKKQVGTVKALGFRNGKIRSKYLMFGVSAAVIGSLLGIGLSVILEKIIIAKLEPRYSFDGIPVVVSAPAAILFCTATLIVVYVVVWAACSHLLKCSAVGLISGSEPAQKSKKKKKKKEHRSSLYSTLILNNVITDITRVIVGITVIAVSGLLIGAGVTLRESFSTAFRQQEETVWLYDLKATIDESASDEIKQEIEDLLSSSGCDYTAAYSGGTIYETKDGKSATMLIVMDEDRLTDFFNVGGSAINGVSLSNNIASAHGLDTGSEFTLYGRSLDSVKATVGGTFNFYIGNMMTVTKQKYHELYGNECKDNCYFVKYSGTDGEALKTRLSDMNSNYSGHVTIETVADQTAKAESLKSLFDMVAVIFIVLAAVLNFLIMINLTNILVSRRMKDILVMRVNGFSMKQAIGYLVRETAFSTAVGIVLSIAAGIPFSQLLVGKLSTTTITLSNDIAPIAWILSVILSIVFAVLINAISFRKIGKTSLVNISQY